MALRIADTITDTTINEKQVDRETTRHKEDQHEGAWASGLW